MFSSSSILLTKLAFDPVSETGCDSMDIFLPWTPPVLGLTFKKLGCGILELLLVSLEMSFSLLYLKPAALLGGASLSFSSYCVVKLSFIFADFVW